MAASTFNVGYHFDEMRQWISNAERLGRTAPARISPLGATRAAVQERNKRRSTRFVR